MLINGVYVNENAVAAMKFDAGTYNPCNPDVPLKRPTPSVRIYANGLEINIRCTREDFDRAVAELDEWHSRKIKFCPINRTKRRQRKK
jgi:hypothetical protein